MIAITWVDRDAERHDCDPERPAIAVALLPVVPRTRLDYAIAKPRGVTRRDPRRVFVIV